MQISLSKDQVLLSQVRESLPRLVDEIDQGIRPGVSIIKDGQSKVVMISTELYEQLMLNREELTQAVQSAAHLLSGLKDLKNGKVVASERFLKGMQDKYGAF